MRAANTNHERRSSTLDLELLEPIAALVRRHAPNDGTTTTVVPGVKLIRSSASAIVQRGVLPPSVCIVAQGCKKLQLGKDVILRYAAGSYIASSIDMPAAGQVVGASRAHPYLSVFFDITPREVGSVLSEAKVRLPGSSDHSAATFVGQCDAKLLDVVLRFMTSLEDEQDAAFLAPSLKRELIYRLVTGPSAAAFCRNVLFRRQDEGIGRAIEWLTTNFKSPLKVEELAKLANMSTSSLHHKFKAFAMMGPLQYQKRLRLEEARRLLMSGLADATSAAFDVGYESPSQFIREYRRLFGLPPLRDVKLMRSTVTRSD